MMMMAMSAKMAAASAHERARRQVLKVWGETSFIFRSSV
jgi:hypothetical protein